jgi:hypothetical protein
MIESGHQRIPSPNSVSQFVASSTRGLALITIIGILPL